VAEAVVALDAAPVLPVARAALTDLAHFVAGRDH
jgi:hypothetical protein